ncbi:MAG: hypothetical protein HY652_09320, partial [Acidobacteria bacterium]|nr:hypothetical protein [Acidobacteriota bacterium]
MNQATKSGFLGTRGPAGLLLALLLFVAGSAAAQNLPPEVIRYADLVLYNGKILTADEAFSTAEAVAVRDGKFLAVGPSDRIVSLAGPETKRIELQGHTVVPGFIATDADNDFAGGNLYKDTEIRGKLLPTQKEMKKGDVLARIRELMKGVPPGEPAFFRFEEESEALYLTKEDLDQVVPKNPVMVTAGSFDSILNSLMLSQLLQVLPKGHPHILKDEKTGEANGRVYGYAMGVVGWDLRPWPRIDESYLDEQKRATQALLGRGVTTLVGHIQGFSLTIFNIQAHRGELNIRVRGSHDFLRQNPFAEAYLRRLGNLVNFGLGNMVKIVGAGLAAIDGNADTASALTVEPKLSAGGFVFGPHGKNNWLGYGPTEKMWDDPSVDRSQTEWTAVMAAIKYGWNFTAMHNVGDGATAIWLEAIEKGLAQPDLVLKPEFRPFGLDHNMFWNPSQNEKLKKFDVRRGLGKMFQRPDMALELYGDRIHDVQPVPQLIKEGLKVHIEGTEPLEEIQKYITRKDEKGRVWG